MSKEQNGNLPEKSTKTAELPKQAERDAQAATIIHPDGRREEVELRSERYWSGVLPRPEDFAKFGEVVPSAPERLLAMAEKEQQHRINIEEKLIPANLSAQKRGQWLGAAVSGLALVLATLSAYIGAPWQISVALVGVPVLSVARSLVSAIRSSDD